MKNKIGGNKAKKGKSSAAQERQFFLRGADQEYAIVKKMLGDCRVELVTEKKETKIGIIRGNMRKRQWISVGLYVIMTPRDFQDDKVDIIHVYPTEQTRLIERYITLQEEESEEIEFDDDLDISVI